MQELLRWILDRLLWLWPLFKVRQWQRAIVVRNGIIIAEPDPGLHWRWPGVDEIRTCARCECVVNLPTAAIETSDGVAVAVSANIAYVVESMTVNYLAVWDIDDSLVNLAIGRIASYISMQESTKLKSQRAQLERALVNDLNKAVKEWGVRVTRVHLTDCVRVRALRHYVEGVSRVDSTLV